MAKKSINDGNELVKLIKIVLVLSILFLAFYGLTVLINKEKKEEKVSTPVSIQFDEILISNIFNQPNNNYYVLIKMSDDKYNKVYDLYLNQTNTRIYTAILDNYFNKSYYDLEANINNDINKLKFNSATLINIVNGKVSSYYQGEDILNQLKKITEK